MTFKTSPFTFSIFSLITNTPTHIPHSSRVYVSTGPVTGECTAEETDDRHLSMEQNIAYSTIDLKLVTYFLYLLIPCTAPSVDYPPTKGLSFQQYYICAVLCTWEGLCIVIKLFTQMQSIEKCYSNGGHL